MIHKKTKRLFRGLVLLLVLGMGGAVYAQTVSPPVVAIRVEGNENVNTQLILSAVSTSLKEPYNPEKVQADVKAIYDLGYFSKVWAETKEYPDGIELIFKVQEFPRIKEIRISGNSALSDDEIRKVMILSPGQVMNWKIFQHDLDRIRALYSDNGFLITAVEEINFSEEAVRVFHNVSLVNGSDLSSFFRTSILKSKFYDPF